MRGDDMARVVSDLIRERLIEPYVDADLRSFDLSIEHRNQTNDTVTLDAAQALKVHNVRGVKCATLTAEKDVLEKYHFKRTWMSPNGVIGNALGGDVFRKPIACRNIPPLVKQWRRPIIIARHAFGDQYKGQDYVAPGSGTLQNKYSPTMGAPYNNHVASLCIRLDPANTCFVSFDGFLLVMFVSTYSGEFIGITASNERSVDEEQDWSEQPISDSLASFIQHELSIMRATDDDADTPKSSS
ncbi:hypothetical protein HPB49_025805 [Dermacentor silvarum]|nr:hypothetical protein HPB49_025805 [Dermacentor silvarum]